MLRILKAVFFSKTEVYNVYFICIFSVADQKIIRLDVTVNEILFVHFRHQLNKLVQNHATCLDAELPVAYFE